MPNSLSFSQGVLLLVFSWIYKKKSYVYGIAFCLFWSCQIPSLSIDSNYAFGLLYTNFSTANRSDLVLYDKNGQALQQFPNIASFRG